MRRRRWLVGLALTCVLCAAVTNYLELWEIWGNDIGIRQAVRRLEAERGSITIADVEALIGQPGTYTTKPDRGIIFTAGRLNMTERWSGWQDDYHWLSVYSDASTGQVREFTTGRVTSDPGRYQRWWAAIREWAVNVAAGPVRHSS